MLPKCLSWDFSARVIFRGICWRIANNLNLINSKSIFIIESLHSYCEIPRPKIGTIKDIQIIYGFLVAVYRKVMINFISNWECCHNYTIFFKTWVVWKIFQFFLHMFSRCGMTSECLHNACTAFCKQSQDGQKRHSARKWD